MVEKLSTIRDRKYLDVGPVESLTDFFSVPKGDDDIRMVFNGTSSGLNDYIWVPSFPMPTVNSVLRSVSSTTWFADSDIGEMFLNFILHHDIQHLAGVDLTCYKTSTDPPGVLFNRWLRAAMGLKSSPYQTTQAMLVAEEVMQGSPSDPSNIFRWHVVALNLPGMTDFDPSEPWVSLRRQDGKLAANFHFYVDDNRTMANTEEETWLATRKVGSSCSYLGIQDAARKRRPPSQRPGAWAGSVIETTNMKVYVMVAQDKWDKCKLIIDTLLSVTSD